MAAEQFPLEARLEPQELLAMEKSAALVPVIATLLMVMVEEVELDRVADWETLLEPTVVDANVRLDGLAVTLPAEAPVPVRVTDCGLLVALSVNRSVADRAPLAVGLNTTDAEQLAPATIVELQEFLLMLKSAALVPEIATPVNVTDEDVALVMSTDCAALVEPIAVEANARLDGFGESVLATTPRPVSATV